MMKFVLFIVSLISIFAVPTNNVNDCNEVVDPNVTCSWKNHCLNSQCISENDCDKDLVCTNNLCAVDT